MSETLPRTRFARSERFASAERQGPSAPCAAEARGRRGRRARTTPRRPGASRRWSAPVKARSAFSRNGSVRLIGRSAPPAGRQIVDVPIDQRQLPIAVERVADDPSRQLDGQRSDLAPDRRWPAPGPYPPCPASTLDHAGGLLPALAFRSVRTCSAVRRASSKIRVDSSRGRDLRPVVRQQAGGLLPVLLRELDVPPDLLRAVPQGLGRVGEARTWPAGRTR